MDRPARPGEYHRHGGGHEGYDIAYPLVSDAPLGMGRIDYPR